MEIGFIVKFAKKNGHISLNAASEKNLCIDVHFVVSHGIPKKNAKIVITVEIIIDMRCSELYGDIETLAEMTSAPM
jgi:hypothetical protein